MTILKPRKYFTTKQWQRFKSNDYFDMQEMLCEKYDIILTDYKTKREQITSILKQINLKNMDKGISTFNKIIQQFGGSMDQLTRDINGAGQGSPSKVKLWSDTPKIYSQSKDQENLDKIWGKRN